MASARSASSGCGQCNCRHTNESGEAPSVIRRLRVVRGWSTVGLRWSRVLAAGIRLRRGLSGGLLHRELNDSPR
jgi:hypothetical protein